LLIYQAQKERKIIDFSDFLKVFWF